MIGLSTIEDAARPLIDAHLHLLDPERMNYPWLADVPAIDHLFLPDDVQTALSPRFVVVQAGVVAEQGLAEAQWIERLAAEGAPVDGIVAFAALERGDGVVEDLRALSKLPSVRGVRRLLQDESPSFFTDEQFRAGLIHVSRLGWSFDACIRWWQLPALVEVLSAVPDLPFVLDHLGKPPVTLDPASIEGRQWREGIERLALLPNAHVKLSGLLAEATDPALPPASLGPWLRAAVDVFGVERAMAGSDWPVSRDQPLDVDYDGWFALVSEELGATPAESELLFAETARTFYRL